MKTSVVAHQEEMIKYLRQAVVAGESLLQEMGLPEPDKEFAGGVVRHCKGILTYWERWLNQQSTQL